MPRKRLQSQKYSASFKMSAHNSRNSYLNEQCSQTTRTLCQFHGMVGCFLRVSEQTASHESVEGFHKRGSRSPVMFLINKGDIREISGKTLTHEIEKGKEEAIATRFIQPPAGARASTIDTRRYS